MEEPVVELGAHHLNALGQHKAPLKLAGGDAPVQINAITGVLLPAADGQLTVLNLNQQVSFTEAGHRQRDSQAAVTDLFDVVGRVSSIPSFCEAAIE